MCTPTLIASAALTAGSAIVGSMGRNQARSAVSGVLNRSLANQRGYRDKALGRVKQTADTFSQPNQDAAFNRIVDKRTGVLQGTTQADTATATPFTRSAPKTVMDTARNADTAITTKANDQAARFARVGAVGEQNLENNIGLQHSADFVNRMGNFARGDLNVVPWQVRDAQQKGYGLRAFSDLLGLGGNVLGNLGFMGKGPSFSKVGSWFSSTPSLSTVGKTLGPNNGLWY